jgi:hypothetical protein
VFPNDDLLIEFCFEGPAERAAASVRCRTKRITQLSQPRFTRNEHCLTMKQRPSRGIVPQRRNRPVHFSFTALNCAGGAGEAMAAITSAVASGELTTTEAAEMSSVVAAYVKAIEATEIERRIKVLEERAARDAK